MKDRPNILKHAVRDLHLVAPDDYAPNTFDLVGMDVAGHLFYSDSVYSSVSEAQAATEIPWERFSALGTERVREHVLRLLLETAP